MANSAAAIRQGFAKTSPWLLGILFSSVFENPILGRIHYVEITSIELKKKNVFKTNIIGNFARCVFCT